MRGGVARRLGSAVAGVVLATLVAVPAWAASPNPSLTPGAVDSRVTQANIATTICRSGYTKTIRDVSTKTKHKVYVEYGVSKSAQRGYVIDHLVPLEVGGSRSSRAASKRTTSATAPRRTDSRQASCPTRWSPIG